MAAIYRLLMDHYLVTPTGQNIYRNAGDVVTEGIDIPVNWPPSLASEPLNAQAATNYFNAGPRALFDAEPYRDFYPLRPNIPPPVTAWQRFPNSNMYSLTGLGIGLGVVGQGGTVGALLSESGQILTSESGTILVPG